MDLAQDCIYTIIGKEKLLEARKKGGSALWQERKVWRTGEKLLHQATKNGQTLPILFADAGDCSELIYWGHVTKIAVDKDSTQYSVRELKPLTGKHTPQELVLSKSGKAIANGFIKPYAICRTPEFLNTSRVERPAYLLTWALWHSGSSLPAEMYAPDGDGMEEWAEKTRRLGKLTITDFRCGNTHVEKGDRIFLLKQGSEPRGLIGAGYALSDSRDHRVDVKFERIVSLHSEYPLPVCVLKTGSLAAMPWDRAQMSGIRIKDEVIADLEVAWQNHLDALTEDEQPEELERVEGEARMLMVHHRKRERVLRRAKITEALEAGKNRLKCEVPGCGFDFVDTYGEVGREYAQVHHLLPLKDRTQATATKLSELAVVCANCHVMIHRGNECREIETLIKKRRSRK